MVHGVCDRTKDGWPRRSCRHLHCVRTVGCPHCRDPTTDGRTVSLPAHTQAALVCMGYERIDL